MMYVKSWLSKYNQFSCFDIHSEIEEICYDHNNQGLDMHKLSS